MPPVRLLIVDPDQRQAKALAQELGAAGFEVALAFDAATAHSLVGDRPPELVLVDALVPTTGGAAFVRHLRDRFPGIPIGAVYLVPEGRVVQDQRDRFWALDDFDLQPPRMPILVERLWRLHGRIQNLPEVVTELGSYAGRYDTGATARRMRLTVLFADVRGYTGLSEGLDPETIAAAMNSLLEHLAQGVMRFGGVIDKFLGDGLMAIFGANEHSADHELAAMYAAAEILETLHEADAATLFIGSEIALGIGLHTGDAVVGPLGPAFRRDVTAMGDTVNIASRVCGEAKPGEILVTAPTYEQVEGRVELLGTREVQLKGKRLPQRVFSVRLA